MGPRTTDGEPGATALRAAFEADDDGVVVHDTDGTVLAANDAAAALLGQSRERLRGAVPERLAADDPAGEALLEGLRAVADGDAAEVDDADGLVVEEDACEWRVEDETWVRATVTAVTVDGARRLVATLRAADRPGRPATGRPAAGHDLERLTSRLEVALSGTDTGVWEWDLDAGEVVWDETAERLFGYEPGEFPGTYEGFVRRVAEADRPQVQRAIQRAFETGEQHSVEFRVEHPDGETRWIRARGVVTDEGETATGPEATESGRMTGIYTDVTERKRRERELEELTTRLELALEETDAGVWEWDVDTDEVVWDESTERLFGYEPGSFPETPEAVRRRIHSDDFLRVVDRAERAVETGGEYRADFRVVHPDGEVRWLQGRGVVEYEDGEPDRMLGIHSDITERKRRERDLKELNTRLELALEGTGTGVWEWNLDTDAVIWDDTSQRLFGYEPGAFPGTYEGFEDRVHPADLPEVERQVEEALDRDEPFQVEFRVVHPDGETRWLQARGDRIDGEVIGHEDEADDLWMLGVQTDITERKRRERDLEELTTRLELALEETDTGVWEWDVDTDEIVWDEATQRLYGYDPETFPGTFEAVSERIHPEDLPRVLETTERAIETGEGFQTDFRVEHPDGETRWIQARGVVEQDGDDAERLVGVQTDITERKRSERELEAKNDRLELLNRIVRHDIRNDMEVILSTTGLLEERLDDTDDVAQCLSWLRQSSTHVVELTELVRDIMQTTREGGTVEPVHLGRVIEDELDTVRSMAGVTVAVEDLPPVRVLADDSLGTVFHNLLTNAVRHNDREEPTVEVSVTEGDERVVVRVADDGPGIPEDRRDAVFARGEKGLESPGSGLGLYLVDRLVKEYGGDVWIEDNDPRGAVFAVALRRPGEPADLEAGVEA